MVSNPKTNPRISLKFSSFDLVGREFSFGFPTFSRKLKTKVGSCLNLLIGAICVLATTLIGSKYFDTSSPSVTFSNQKGQETPHNLAKELLVPPIAVYMEGAPLSADISKFATLRLEPATFGFDAESNGLKVLSLFPSDLVDCKELNDPYYNKLLSKIDSKNKFKDILKCPDFKGNYSLSEVVEDNNKNLLFILLTNNYYT